VVTIKSTEAPVGLGEPVVTLTWHGHSAFRVEAGAAEMLIDPLLSENPSWDKGWSGYLAGKNSTQGGDR
jgi:L-ascorbate metabolism protein UlaG (beta-lactamase superfamily)